MRRRDDTECHMSFEAVCCVPHIFHLKTVFWSLFEKNEVNAYFFL